MQKFTCLKDIEEINKKNGDELTQKDRDELGTRKLRAFLKCGYIKFEDKRTDAASHDNEKMSLSKQNDEIKKGKLK